MFVNFYAIHYGDTVEQTKCTFSRSIGANDITTTSLYTLSGTRFAKIIGANSGDHFTITTAKAIEESRWHYLEVIWTDFCRRGVAEVLRKLIPERCSCNAIILALCPHGPIGPSQDSTGHRPSYSQVKMTI